MSASVYAPPGVRYNSRASLSAIPAGMAGSGAGGWNRTVNRSPPILRPATVTFSRRPTNSSGSAPLNCEVIPGVSPGTGSGCKDQHERLGVPLRLDVRRQHLLLDFLDTRLVPAQGVQPHRPPLLEDQFRVIFLAADCRDNAGAWLVLVFVNRNRALSACCHRCGSYRPHPAPSTAAPSSTEPNRWTRFQNTILHLLNTSR
jgi:hypothetical protein